MANKTRLHLLNKDGHGSTYPIDDAAIHDSGIVFLGAKSYAFSKVEVENNVITLNFVEAEVYNLDDYIASGGRAQGQINSAHWPLPGTGKQMKIRELIEIQLAKEAMKAIEPKGIIEVKHKGRLEPVEFEELFIDPAPTMPPPIKKKMCVNTNKHCGWVLAESGSFGDTWLLGCQTNTTHYCESPEEVGMSFAPLPIEKGNHCNACGKPIKLLDEKYAPYKRFGKLVQSELYE